MITVSIAGGSQPEILQLVKKALKEEFAEVFDASTKKFKKGEAFDESAKFFKRAALNMKLKQAGVFAGIASGIALVSSAIASKISNN